MGKADFKKYKSIAIMGGAFDPPHFGHFVTAQTVYDSFDVDKVIEQLKLELEEVFEEDIAIEEFSKGTWNRAINKAIEIVKKGGEDNKGRIDKRRCH